MQNEKTLQQMIKEHEEQMPPEIMNLIKSFDWKKEIRTIVNQNQLMIDVGSDLEESTYLMLLGVVKAADLYERLIDVHQIPQDKAQKIIQELETQIFNPLHKKLVELDEKPIDSTPRAAILEEIEREPGPLIKFNVAPAQTPATAPVQENAPVASSNTDGIAKPFTLSTQKTIEVEKEKLAAPTPNPTSIPTPTPIITPVQGVQEDPITAGLTKPTAMGAPTPSKPSVVDPYREPIE